MSLSMSIPSLNAFLNHVTGFTNTLIAQSAKEMLDLAEVGDNLLFGHHLSGIIHDLLHIGLAFCDYDDHNPHEFGFPTRDALMEALRQVQTKWTGQIIMEWEGETTVNYRAHTPGPGEKVDSVLFAQFVHGTEVTSCQFEKEPFMAYLRRPAEDGQNPLHPLGILADEGAKVFDRESPASKCLLAD